MKVWIPIIILLTHSCKGNAQSSAVQKFIDTSLQVMEKNAVNSPRVDWVKLRVEIAKRIKDVKRHSGCWLSH